MLNLWLIVRTRISKIELSYGSPHLLPESELRSTSKLSKTTQHERWILHTKVRASGAQGDTMRRLLFEGPAPGPCNIQPFIKKLASERLPVLVARRAARLLQDAALTSLFHSYRVELFEKPFDLFVARAALVSYALLCASAGCSLLAAEAYIIRKQWPFAKIIVLGSAPHDLKDHLYDDMVITNCSPAILATAFSNRSGSLWNRRVGWIGTTSEPWRMPEESDPTKANPSDLEHPPSAEPRKLPARR